jgi:queuosine precursor transporter
MNAVVLLYLGAVVAANLIVTAFGPAASVLTAFALIGLNITARDRLHDSWQGRGLRWRLGLLIAVGGGVSWLLNAEAFRIALASSVAFAVSETADALVYHALRDKPWFGRVNGSNAVSSAIDSLVFPTIAFGGLLPLIVLGQFLAKTCGGALWAFALKPKRLAYAALFVVLAAPLDAQFVSVGVGGFKNEFVQDPVAELVVGSPAVSGFRATVIGSWTLDPWGAKPVVIPQLGRDLIGHGRFLLGADAGAVFVPWTDYKHPHPTVSARLFVFLPLGFKVVAIGAVQPWHDEKSLVVKLDRTLWFRR